MTALGKDFAMLLLVSGNWHTLAKLETELQARRDFGRHDQRAPHRASARRARTWLPIRSTSYASTSPASCTALPDSSPSRGIDIGELSTRSYAAAHTGAPMFSVYMVVNVPTRIHVGALREEFMDLCDQLNLDAILEPVKA